MKYSQLLLIMVMFGSLACGLPFLVEPTATPLPSPTASVVTPTPAPSATVTLVPSATSVAPTATSPSGVVIPGAPSGPYAVVLIAAGDVLYIRASPGVENAVVGEFQPTAAAVMRTGPASNVGGSLWVEVQNPSGGNGWVNSHFLTEYVAPPQFCAAAPVTALLDQFKSAMTAADGDLFASLVSPAHGLDLRVWRYGTVANYDRAEAAFAFDSTYQVSWGPAPGSGAATLGTFAEVPLPRLIEVLNAAPERHCNDPLDLATFSLEPWPAEYANVNFYNLYKPGTDAYGGLDWRAWLAGVEYVQGQPQLFALIHFQWEP